MRAGAAAGGQLEDAVAKSGEDAAVGRHAVAVELIEVFRQCVIRLLQLRRNFLCLDPALTVHAHFGEKCELIDSPVDDQVPAVPVTCFAHAGDPALHTHTK